MYNKNQIRNHLFLVLIFYAQPSADEMCRLRGAQGVRRAGEDGSSLLNGDKEVPMSTDLLYYIMDYSGNYYRVSKADQLVAAASEEEATVFTFAQANSRIGGGKKSSFSCMISIEEGEGTENSCEIREEGMPETEDANCNVAQGYKVFKRLKELRLERKAKLQELDCLYA